uniref:EF-hand domain family member D1 n=1 Tax=Anas platyrhynchos TaxID=8839 RepID=A0A8B9R4F3_ANAPL
WPPEELAQKLQSGGCNLEESGAEVYGVAGAPGPGPTPGAELKRPTGPAPRPSRGRGAAPCPPFFNPYTEFKEFSRCQIKDRSGMFLLLVPGGGSGGSCWVLGLCRCPSPEFLLIFHKAAAGELEEDSGLLTLAKLSEIDVSIEGVKGAKNFFEAKVQALSSASKFEAEIRAEQDERKREEEERKHRRAAFRELKSAFTQ